MVIRERLRYTGAPVFDLALCLPELDKVVVVRRVHGPDCLAVRTRSWFHAWPEMCPMPWDPPVAWGDITPGRKRRSSAPSVVSA